MRSLSYLFLALFIIACVPSTPIDQLPPAQVPPVPERKEPKVPDPIIQEECESRSSRNNCEGNEDCEDICDDIFSNRRQKSKCYDLPEALVFDFEELIEYTEDGDVEAIDTKTLECLLNIDDREFAKAVRNMSKRDAQEFLVMITEDSDLATILEKEDDEFMILEQLLGKATSGDLSDQLIDEIDNDDRGFLWLAASGNEASWEWLNDYVNEECDSKSSCDDNIELYCTALTSTSKIKRNLEDFLSEASFFADEYEREVEDANYEYDIIENRYLSGLGDFEDYCAVGIRGECPMSVPGDDLSLGSFELEDENNGDARRYAHEDYRWTDIATTPGEIGRGPSDNEILSIKLNNDETEVILNGDYYDDSSGNQYTYYIYIDGKRYELERRRKYTANNGVEHIVRVAPNAVKNDKTEIEELYILVHNVDDNECEIFGDN